MGLLLPALVKVGRADLKGIGPTVLFQLERATADLAARVEVRKRDYDALNEERDDLRARAARLEAQNRSLEGKLRAAGEEPDPEDLAEADDDGNEAWKPVKRAIGELKTLISGAPGSSVWYARFIFLHFAGKGAEESNSFEGKTFDELIEANLVSPVDGSDETAYFELNTEHRRNEKVMAVLQKAESALTKYLKKHRRDANDLFDWTFVDPEFWEKYVGYDVL